MSVETRTKGKITILDVRGRLTVGQEVALRDKVRELLAAGEQRFILDMSDVPFMDSAFISFPLKLSFTSPVRIARGPTSIKVRTIRREEQDRSARAMRQIRVDLITTKNANPDRVGQG